MQQAASEWRAPPGQLKALRMGLRVAACIVLAGIGSILLPVVPILLGVLLIVAAVIHACLPALRPYTSMILRAPIARTGRLHLDLPVAAAAGVLLLASGTAGATLRGKVFSQWEQRSQRHEATSGKVDGLLAQARESLARGDVNGAEYLLLSIEPAEAVDAGRREEVDELGKRLRRCGDPEVILDILVALPADDLAALENHSAIPGALDFGDPALTYRAVDTALTLVDEARRLRAGR